MEPLKSTQITGDRDKMTEYFQALRLKKYGDKNARLLSSCMVTKIYDQNIDIHKPLGFSCFQT